MGELSCTLEKQLASEYKACHLRAGGKNEDFQVLGRSYAHGYPLPHENETKKRLCLY